MATQNKAEAAASRAHRSPEGARSSILRLAVPMLFAAMGISLGTLTGIAFAFATVPVGAQSASNNPSAGSTASASLPASQNSAVSAADTKVVVSQNSASDANGDAKQVALVEVADHSDAPKHDSEPSNAIQAKSVDSQPNPAEKIDRSPSEPASPDALVADEIESTRRSAPADQRHSKLAAHPDPNPAQSVLASLSDATPAPVVEQFSFSDNSGPSTFSSEGDVTVADYNPTAGTIETSDGRTFALGTTVSSNTASSWEDYRSNVHFRCGQNGSCMLMRHGVIAPNARLIDRGHSEDSGLNQGT
jgi:hypothetical protein